MRNAVALMLLILTALISFTIGRSYPDTPQSDEELELGILLEPSSSLSQSNPEERAPEYEWYPVVKVVDGDTLVIAMNGKSETLRLIGIDTPETVDPRKTVQCFGKEASEKAKDLLSGNSVRLEMDVPQGERDKYGRRLAYAYLPSGMNVAEYMIAEGYGHEYTYNIPYKYQTDFKAAEQKAREEKRGLWADDACAKSASSFELSASSNSEIQNGKFECSKNTYNCSSFKTQAEAQAAFESCGGNGNDIHKLDSDSDGEVCESLP